MFCIVFLLPTLLISFKKSPTLTFEKLKLCGWNSFLKADTLGWLRKFITAFKVEWEMHSTEKLNFLNPEIFKCNFFKSFYLIWQKRFYCIRAGEMDFKVEGSWNTGKYCRPPWLTDQNNFWILDALE